MLVKYLILYVCWLINLTLAFEPEVTSTERDSASHLILYFDDTSNVLELNDKKVYLSKDDGKTWKVNDDIEEEVEELWSDPVDRKRGFAITSGDTLYMTTDQGENWKAIKFPVPSVSTINLQSNFANSKLILASVDVCDYMNGHNIPKCSYKFYYTDDGFQSEPKLLNVDNVFSCTFLKTNENFKIGADERILCITAEYDSFEYVKDVAIYESSDWFKTKSLVDDKFGVLSSSFVLDLEVVQSFVVVIVQTDRYKTDSSVDFYVSKDGSFFERAHFDQEIKSQSYSILPSTPNSLHISTTSYKNSRKIFASGDIYISDSSGLYYTKSLTSVLVGALGSLIVEKIDNIDGGLVASQISSADESGLFRIKSRITVDDGYTWDVLKVLDDDKCSNDEKCSLNLYSMQEMSGEGRFVTGPTPGILMGFGVIGSESGTLMDISKSSTFISRDGGRYWKKVLDYPSAFVFGDQGNIIVALPITGLNESNFLTSNILYSFDQGETWDTYKLDRDILATSLITTIDGSSSKFILLGLYLEDGKGKEKFQDTKGVVYALDFSKAFDGKVCKDEDFEEWYAREDDKGEGQCLFGHKEKFKRRKQDAKCLVNRLFEDVKEIEESCECTEKDYECSLGFVRDEKGGCIPDVRVIADNFCRDNDLKKIKLPLRRKVPGSLCRGGVDLGDEKKEFDCKKIMKDDKLTRIFIKSQSFEGSVSQYYYLQSSSNDTLTDETLVLRTTENVVYYSFNGGETFYKMDDLESTDDEFIAIILNPYFPDYIYLITSNSKIYISEDRGITYVVHKAPAKIKGYGPNLLSFHKKDPKKFILQSQENCKNLFSPDCKFTALQTEDGGASFKPLLDDVRLCYYVGSTFDSSKYDVDPNLIYCEKHVEGANYLSLVSSSNGFDKKKVLFEKIVGMGVIGDFVIVAAINTDKKSLEAHVTVDGKDFADALFPPDFHVDRQQAYTIIDSSTKSLIMHVTTNSKKDAEFGTILKSNSNGTSYVKSIDYVNRNTFGYVDYEKVQGMEGVSLINVVDNAHSVKAGKSEKKLKSMITHNDGSEWNYIVPPAIDSKGKKYHCKGKSLEDCSLNLHGFTERLDLRDTYSSGSAIGMMIGVGNVGKHLHPFSKDDDSLATFMTKDGGITWKEIKKGAYMWEFGDQGTILVLAPNNGKPTNTISFSLDEGDTWNDFTFSDELVHILDLATVPSDTARKFLLFARTESNVVIAFNLDFTHIQQRQCKLDFDNPQKGDFEYWSPKNPFLLENCLFGHEAMYLRRISSHSDCFIGAAPLNNAYKELRNCACTRKDFECDYNYVKLNDGTCKLVEGLSPADHSAVCAKDKSLTEFWEPTGYRKIALSTCEGGKQLDKWISHPCPGKEFEFDKKHSIKGFALFLTIFVPIVVFIGASWFVYDRGIRRNGGFSRFGQIRLDEDDFHPIENNQTDKVVNDIVKGIILGVGALITLRSILKSKIIGLFTRRNRFERVFGQDHDVILDDDSLFNFNDIDNDEDATEIDSFIQHNDDDFSTTTMGQEAYSDNTEASPEANEEPQVPFNDEVEDDLTDQPR